MSVGRVAQVPLSKLRCSDENPRVISDEGLERLKRALEADPEMLRARPVIALPDGRVVAGNMRLRAAQELGWKTIPAVRADLDEERARLWMLRDNQEYGEWEQEGLAAMLAELEASGADLELTGFEQEELDKLLLSTVVRGDPDEPAPEPPSEPESRRGEVYELGLHRLMCGDATSDADMAQLMAGSLAELVFTDPPYGVMYEGGLNARKRTQMEGDDRDVYAASMPMAASYSDEAAPLYVWFAGALGLAAYRAADLSGYDVRSMLVWNKLNPHYGAYMAQYMQRHEPCLYAVKRGKTPRWCGPTNEVTVWDVEQPTRNEFHPTQKPTELARRALTNHGSSSVLDLFGGSGSTLLAAELEGCRSFLMEIDPGYCDVIRQRYAKFMDG